MSARVATQVCARLEWVLEERWVDIIANGHKHTKFLHIVLKFTRNIAKSSVKEPHRLARS